MIEGKTKQILEGPNPGTVICRAKDVLTGGDAARVADISSIGVLKTTQTVNVFVLLERLGVPTAFVRQLDDRSVLCWDCEMLPVEFVLRRYPWGSYLQRNPDPATKPEAPQRFDNIVLEMFHKHAMILPPASSEPHLLRESIARDLYLRDGTWAEGVYTDPYVEVRGDRWHLHPAKAPFVPGATYHDVPAVVSAEASTAIDETILLPAFRALEDAWHSIETVEGPVALVDCKFEVGIRRSDGAYVLADVVDNDSWRIWPGGDPRLQLDKQRFRDGEPLSRVSDAYHLVTDLTSQLVVEGDVRAD